MFVDGLGIVARCEIKSLRLTAAYKLGRRFEGHRLFYIGPADPAQRQRRSLVGVLPDVARGACSAHRIDPSARSGVIGIVRRLMA